MINNTPPRTQATPEERRKIARIFADTLAEDPAYLEFLLSAIALHAFASTFTIIGNVFTGAKLVDRVKEKCAAQGIHFPDIPKGGA